MMMNKGLLKSSTKCALCDQFMVTNSGAQYWHRGTSIVCYMCLRDRGPEARAWIDGFDEALKWNDGQAN